MFIACAGRRTRKWPLFLSALVILAIGDKGHLARSQEALKAAQPASNASSADESLEESEGHVIEGAASEPLSEQVADPGFERYADVRLLKTAYEQVDSALMTDVALQLAEGERVLLRPHQAISAKSAILAAAELAAKKGDQSSLKRLQKHLANGGDQELVKRLQALVSLSAQQRAATPDLDVKIDTLTPNEAEIVRGVTRDLERAKYLGGRTAAQDVVEFIKTGVEIGVMPAELANKLTRHAQAVAATVSQELKEEPDSEINTLVARLSTPSRGGIFGNDSPPQTPELAAPGPKPDAAGRRSYPIGNEKVRFLVKKISGGSLNVASMKPHVLDLVNLPPTTITHIWDDKWYKRTLPPNYSEYWMMVAHNITRKTFTWAVIKNTPSTWYVLFNDGSIKTPGNGDQAKYRMTWSGQVVDLDVRNPKNIYGITGNDIFYGFGY